MPSQVKLKEKVPITMSFFLYDILCILRDPSELNELNMQRKSNLINQRLNFLPIHLKNNTFVRVSAEVTNKITKAKADQELHDLCLGFYNKLL